MSVRRRRREEPRSLTTPLDDLDPEALEVIEPGGPGPLRRSTPPEAPYAPRRHDPGSLAGLWDALQQS